MVERRGHHRFDTEVRVTVSTIQFVSNVKTEAYLTDCNRTGVRIVSPLYFEPNEQVELKVDMLGGPLQIQGKVIECREDASQKYRFEKTYVLHVEFYKLSDHDWNKLLAAGKR